MSLTWDFQTIESFDVITDSTGAHAALNAVHGPVPPFSHTGADARWSFSSTGYVLVTPGLYGIGQCIKRCNAVTFSTENATTHPGYRARFAFKAGGFTGTRVLCTIGQVTTEVTSGGVLQYHNTSTGSTVTSSQFTFTAGVVYLFELCIYIDATNGAYRYHIDGVQDTSLTASGINTKGAAGLPTAFSFNDTNTTFDLHVDNFRLDASDSSLSGAFDAGDFMTSPSVLPRMQTLIPVSQGHYSQFHTCGDHVTADPFCAVTSAGSSNNYTFVNDVPSDEKKSFLQDGTDGHRDSWMHGNLLAEVGTIYMLQTNHATWGDGAGRTDFHSIYIAGDFDHANNNDFQFIGSGAQIGWTCRMWALNPSTGVAWVPADFPLDVGQKIVGTAAPLGITQACVIIDYLATAEQEVLQYGLALSGVLR